VQKIYAGRLLDLGGKFMHGIVGHDDEIRPTVLQAPRGICKQGHDRVQIAPAVVVLDCGMIYRVQQDAGGMLLAELLLRVFVDHPVIPGCGFPTQTAQHPDQLHGRLPAR
jgi:hypothetical protein